MHDTYHWADWVNVYNLIIRYLWGIYVRANIAIVNKGKGGFKLGNKRSFLSKSVL